ncbi:MAG: AAA family ATPase [Sedimenticola sp.]|uniref:AAA family ATPase n=1 Tax=Sedimenticola thiotaurini TaxID=1543721 RepID=A0A558D6P2_9GAMM|nr:AAA family ATPase [Sedimenticola sp.]MCW8881159.1 AAA family ATPase [Sedimenticola sp.]MCW8947160.1 AAA family ATPase [Sedimenticola sp.]MCW8975907.1 AAA family ATPase [Sedimenticola sp.]TVT56641.1 MAG: AAA family ATPase [Sedimenticola thiotaurini]
MITVVGSLKGGSGKSTVTFNLAVWLAMAEVDVQVVDLDPQATLRDVAEVRDEEGYRPKISVKGKKYLDIDKLRRADEVLIDIGTADIEMMKQAIRYADRILVPVPPSQADIWSTQRFIQFVNSVTDGHSPEIIGFINRGDTHHAVRETDEAAAALVTLPGMKFIKPRLSQRTIFRRSFSEGLAVFELNQRGKGAKELSSLCAKLYPNVLK